MKTVLRSHPEQYLQKSHFARYLQYFRDVGPSVVVTKPTSGLCELDLEISEGCPEQYLHTQVHTPRTTSKANPPMPRSGL